MLFVLALFLSAGLLFLIFPSGRATVRTARLLPALLTPAESFDSTHESVRHTQMTLPLHNSQIYLDIYEPTSPVPTLPGTRGGVVIVPGVGDHRQLPQLVHLAQSLVRVDLVVVIVTTPTLMQYDLSAQDSDAVVEAFRTLTHHSGVSAERIGLIGFSAGTPITCFAAADSRIRDQVAFVVLFGGYFNATTMLRAVGQRAVNVDGQTQSWQPQETSLKVLSNVIGKTLSPSERSLLRSSLTPDGKPLSTPELTQLSPAADAAYHLLAGDAPEKVEIHLTTLTPQMHAQLDELSPNRVLPGIQAPIFLLHSLVDQSIPFTESRHFATALERLDHPYDLVEIDFVSHVELREGLGIGQLAGNAFHLSRILYKMLLISS